MEQNQSQKILTALSWDAPEYEHIHRSSDWYWSLWIISISLAITSILFKNTLLGILILLIAFTVSLLGHRKPKIIRFRIDQKGVYIEERVYLYSELESFAIEEMPGPRSKLILKSQKKLMPYIIIPIDDSTREEIRYIVSGVIAEDEHKEPIFLKILEYIGF